MARASILQTGLPGGNKKPPCPDCLC